MTIEELSQLLPLRSEIKYYEQRLQKLRTAMERPKTDLADLLTNEDMLVYCGKAKEFETLFTQTLKRGKEELQRLEDYVASVSDPFIRQLIELRFIRGLSWRQCAFYSGAALTEKNAQQLCRRYMKKHPE